jgi:hypothetical protein
VRRAGSAEPVEFTEPVAPAVAVDDVHVMEQPIEDRRGEHLVDGGPLTAVGDGDRITVDVAECALDVALSPDEIERPLEGVAPPPPCFTRGVMARDARAVGSAAKGASIV